MHSDWNQSNTTAGVPNKMRLSRRIRASNATASSLRRPRSSILVVIIVPLGLLYVCLQYTLSQRITTGRLELALVSREAQMTERRRQQIASDNELLATTQGRKEKKEEEDGTLKRKIRTITKRNRKLQNQLKRVEEKDKTRQREFEGLLEETTKEKQEKQRTVQRLVTFEEIRVTVAHQPRPDGLGSFVLPSIFLHAICHRYGWEQEIIPYDGSEGEKFLRYTFARGEKIDKGWGDGMNLANFRTGHDPTRLNGIAHEELGFFFSHSERQRPHFRPYNSSEWTVVTKLPNPRTGLTSVCNSTNIVAVDGHLHCRLVTPFNRDTGAFLRHMESNGGLDAFFTPQLRKNMRDRFLEANARRVRYFAPSRDVSHPSPSLQSHAASPYHVAIHVRRGDINGPAMAGRFTEQSTFAATAREICRRHPVARVHVFSAGPNRDGGWRTLERVNDTCGGGVAFHLDDYEFDVLAHFVAADALVLSKSALSYAMAFLSDGEVYAPALEVGGWGHPPLKHWHVYSSAPAETLDIKQ